MNRTGLIALLIVCFALFGTAMYGCGGGSPAVPASPGNDNSGTSQAPGNGNPAPPGDNNIIDNGGYVAPPSGVNQYNGRPGPIPPSSGGNGPIAQPVAEEFGKSIIVLPQNSSGLGTALLKEFDPGQKVVLITTNLDTSYLNYSAGSSVDQPFRLPDSFYFFSASNLGKAASGIGAETPKPQRFDVSKDPYYGLRFGPNDKIDPAVLGQRELDYARKTGYLGQVTEVTRRPSTLSKGIVRTFTAVDATIQMPPIEDPTATNPPTTILTWPWIYQYQDGRLVGIGSHCYVFLSTEINNGYPDGYKFTAARIQRLIQEFDSKIYPTSQAAFGPVRTFNEETIYFPPDRNLRLTPADFDSDGVLLKWTDPPQDNVIEKDDRIIVAILNGVSPGGGGFYIAPGNRPPQEPDPNSPYQKPPTINFDAFSTIYLDPSNFPDNSDDWSGGYSVLAHEFQHKLHADNAVSNSLWLNEGMSMLNIYLNGYSLEKGNVIGFFRSQVEAFMQNPEVNAMFNNGSEDQSQSTLYATWYMFMLYVMEHYGPGTIRYFYTNTSRGDIITRLEAATGEPARYTFEKWIIANYVDGLDVPPRNLNETDAAYIARVPLADPRFRYATFDVKGRLGNTNDVLPGMVVHRFPETQEYYPVNSAPRLVKPWCAEYILFENGTGGDLRVLVDADPNFKTFVLPLNYDAATTELRVDTDVFIP